MKKATVIAGVMLGFIALVFISPPLGILIAGAALVLGDP